MTLLVGHDGWYHEHANQRGTIRVTQQSTVRRTGSTIIYDITKTRVTHRQGVLLDGAYRHERLLLRT